MSSTVREGGGEAQKKDLPECSFPLLSESTSICTSVFVALLFVGVWLCGLLAIYGVGPASVLQYISASLYLVMAVFVLVAFVMKEVT